jgi:hypothetical protein
MNKKVNIQWYNKREIKFCNFIANFETFSSLSEIGVYAYSGPGVVCINEAQSKGS